MEAELEKLLGGDDTQNWEFYEEMMDIYEEKWGRIMFGAYLMGARDRERMLR
ncbi:MAG: hypothetical protein LUH14_02545 [Clostridiaceae bacterium]|nr:hypothetical protein [Clostridiaceae bacterium]